MSWGSPASDQKLEAGRPGNEAFVASLFIYTLRRSELGGESYVLLVNPQLIPVAMFVWRLHLRF